MSDNAKTLEERVASLEDRVPAPKKVVKAPDDIPLAVCNAKAREVSMALFRDKRDTATVAKKAIDEALKGRAGRQPTTRTQKAIAPMAAEMVAKVAKVAK
jgi:hypothetical protein